MLQPDTGYAVQTSGNKVLVAGEAVKGGNKDTFLMEVRINNGVERRTETFFIDGWSCLDTGAFSQGNIDLHQSDDGWLIMGNYNQDVIGIDTTRPHLIERYNTRQKKCGDRSRNVEKNSYGNFQSNDAESQTFTITAVDLDIDTDEHPIEQDVLCPKYKVSDVCM